MDIAIPNYNYGRFLHECIASVYRQGIEDIRILIIDNASTDDSVAIARYLAARDPRIELCLRPENLGQHASFNTAVDWAQSEYFVILCSDDYLPDGALGRAVAALDRHPEAHLAFGDTLFLTDGSAPPARAIMPADERVWSGESFLRASCERGRNLIGGPMAVVRTSAQKRAGHFRRDLPHTDDMEMWLRFAAMGAVVEIDHVQSIVRIHGSNQSAVVSNVHHWNVASEAAFEAFFSGFGRSLPQARELLALARRSLSDRAYWCAVSHVLRGEPGVWDLARYAVKLRPTSAVFPPLGYAWRKASLWQRMRTMLSGRTHFYAQQTDP
ncbi:glycosyltransferase family A protein [Shinella sp.]|uniref:glycosyltransferase family A protein n=1 Tax=Shinella sp. TaxID=1870904 RepID=UPI003F6E5BFF